MHSTRDVFDMYVRESKKYPYIHILNRTPEIISVQVDCTEGTGLILAKKEIF